MPKFNTEIQYKGFTFIAKIVHAGQCYPYGYTFRIYDINTNCLDKDIVVDMIKTILCPEDKNVPVKEEWRKLKGPANYFRGYYTIEKIPNGWRYILNANITPINLLLL